MKRSARNFQLPMTMYPVALELSGRRCLIVGGGAVAARKARTLLECSARVVVVSPQLCDEFAALREGWEHHARLYLADDCADCALIFACTDSPEVNSAIANDARALNIWCNRADASEDSDFHSMAAFYRGDICIALSTGGGSPALAKHLRARLEDCVGPEYAELLELLQSRRAHVKTQMKEQAERADFWRSLLDGAVLSLLREGRRDEAEQLLDELKGERT